MRSPILIINADDLGRDEAHNAGIVSCFTKGWCSSTTLLANMPLTDAALRIVREHGWQDRVGVHLNLTQGRPLSDDIRACGRFCDADGSFRPRARRNWHLDPSERAAVAGELRAQIARCRAAGIPLTHADSHNHIHEEWGVLTVVIEVLRKAGIPALRLARNIGACTSRAKSVYRKLINHRIAAAGLARVERFGRQDDFQYELEHRPERLGSCEVMIHPALGPDGVVYDSFLKRPMSEFAPLWAGRKLSSYRERAP